MDPVDKVKLAKVAAAYHERDESRVDIPVFNMYSIAVHKQGGKYGNSNNLYPCPSTPCFIIR